MIHLEVCKNLIFLIFLSFLDAVAEEEEIAPAVQGDDF